MDTFWDAGSIRMILDRSEDNSNLAKTGESYETVDVPHELCSSTLCWTPRVLDLTRHQIPHCNISLDTHIPLVRGRMSCCCVPRQYTAQS